MPIYQPKSGLAVILSVSLHSYSSWLQLGLRPCNYVAPQLLQAGAVALPTTSHPSYSKLVIGSSVAEMQAH